jgi:hypothetical protein
MMLTDSVVATRLMPWWANVTGAAVALKAYTYLRYGVEVVLFSGIFLVGWSRRRKPVSGPPSPLEQPDGMGKGFDKSPPAP